jgi:mannose-6-phosphate isomerase-like protein (cupin superfamily)
MLATDAGGNEQATITSRFASRHGLPITNFKTLVKELATEFNTMAANRGHNYLVVELSPQQIFWPEIRTLCYYRAMRASESTPAKPIRNSIKIRSVASRARGAVNFVKKGWGSELWIANNSQYCGKLLRINKGKRCSLHFHKIKTESFYLHSGRLLMRLMDSQDADTIEEFILEAGQCMDIPVGLIHQMVALEDAELFEFSTQHFDSDSHRLKPGD